MSGTKTYEKTLKKSFCYAGTYGSVISTCARVQQWARALSLLQEMRQASMSPLDNSAQPHKRMKKQIYFRMPVFDTDDPII